MKTATIPNDPSLTTLMAVTAELTVALEQYELVCRGGIVNSMHDAVAEAVVQAGNHIDDLTDKDLKLIEAIVSDAVHQACDYQSRYIQIHERSIGLIADTSPASQAVIACSTYAQHTAHYWEQV